MNEELEARNRRLEQAWEAIHGGILEHRVPPDESTYVSEPWARVLGYRLDELPPLGELLAWLSEQIHPEDRATFERTYIEFVEGRSERYDIEVRVRHRAGHWIWVRKICRALERDEGGMVRRALRMMIDITDLKQTQQELLDSERRFREMADGLPFLVWVHDEAGNQELVNETFCEFFDVSREDMKGDWWQALLHPDDADGYVRAFRAAIEHEHPFHAEARVRHADGSWRWIESWGRPRRSVTGEFRGFVGTSVDVTRRRRMEAALRDSEERFRTLADNLPQLAWMAHGDGRIFWYNKRWFDFTGTTLEEMQGTGWRAVHHPEHAQRVVANLRNCFERGLVWEDTFPLRGADGHYRWFLSRAVPIRNESGDVVRWFGTHTDVTEQREAEEQLQQAARHKDEFLAMLGHELRNPLAAVQTASEVMKMHGGDNPGLARSQAVLERQTAHMAKLLDGLLDLSRIVRGKIRLHRERVDFVAVCREVVGDAAARHADRAIDLRTDLPADPIWVEADRIRLAQIADNLLSNAVKFTSDGGSITVQLRRDNGMAVLSVRDTGVGIEPELLPHIFETFRQSEQSLDRSAGGLGIGLALVKTLAERHGGVARARSAGRGRGAEFVVELPMIDDAESSQETSMPPRAAGPGTSAMEILLIEDNEDAAEMLKQVLELCGHRVAVAATGEEGLEAARSLQPDVVLCDLGLPHGMSGFDVAHALRADSRTKKIRLVALSGYGRPEDKASAARAGFDDHLTKPADVAALRAVLAASEARG